MSCFAAGRARPRELGIEPSHQIRLELVRAISTDPEIQLAARLRERGRSVLELDEHDDDARPVGILMVVERRKKVPALLELVAGTDPNAISTVSDVKRVLGAHAAIRRGPWFTRFKRK